MKTLLKVLYVVMLLVLIGFVSTASTDATKPDISSKPTLSTDKDGKLIEGQRFYVKFPYYENNCLCQVLKEEKVICVCDLTDILATQMMLDILTKDAPKTEDGDKPLKKEKDIEL